MKRVILILLIFFSNISTIVGQEINQKDIDTTSYVLSQLLATTTDEKEVVIYVNAIDQIRKKYKVNKAYSTFVDSLKSINPHFKKVVISLKGSPQFPKFSHREIADLMYLKNNGIQFKDLHQILILKKLKKGTIRTENLSDFEKNRLKNFKTQVESIKLEN